MSPCSRLPPTCLRCTPSAVHERTKDEALLAHKIVGVKTSIFLDNPAVLLREVPIAELNKSITDIVYRIEPQVLLLPFYDRHIDHRIVFDAGMVAARPVGIGRKISVVATYETLSETHWNAPHLEPNFIPNWCVDITDHIDPKLQAMRAYESQLQEFPAARSVDALRALALFRGSQISVGFAEAFQIVRMTAPPEMLAGASSMPARAGEPARHP